MQQFFFNTRFLQMILILSYLTHTYVHVISTIKNTHLIVTEAMQTAKMQLKNQSALR